MNRYVCIHGHFYQPPRENPWLEEIELQDSAYPYHDWNDRITAECYAPNAVSRILDSEGRIIDMVNNYSKISFNFGPTLLSWMEIHVPQAYQAILDADRMSIGRFSGHGCAMAQVYNHLIMPLASLKDKHTQVLWGIRDFMYRFKRYPEGLWLAETAVDTETLEVLAYHGILYTILAPNQAQAVRKIPPPVEETPHVEATNEEDSSFSQEEQQEPEWSDVSGERIDPSMAYRCLLPSGRSIAVFFYDGPISKDVAFNGMLTDARHFAWRLLGAFNNERDWPQLVHIGNDGETYGHHHHRGDMALAYCLYLLESGELTGEQSVELTNYGEYLEKYPPAWEVKIHENSSWSCIHGIGRWKENCGCHTGMHQGWTQEWRKPLRDAMDWLRGRLSAFFEDKAARHLKDPWEARNDYIDVMLDRSKESLDRFFDKHALHPLDSRDRVTLLKLLEMERQALLMYTSCGWFFDEVSGIENVQIMNYAAMAMHYVRDLGGQDLEPDYIEHLRHAPSNILQNAAEAYERYVMPSRLDIFRVAAHYALSSLFEDYARDTVLFCYRICCERFTKKEAQSCLLVTGKLLITSLITTQENTFVFAALYCGDHNIEGGVREYSSEEDINALESELFSAFGQGQMAGLLARAFPDRHYTLGHLFREEQRKILNRILEPRYRQIDGQYRTIYESNYALLSFFKELGIPLPRDIFIATEYTLARDLLNTFEEKALDLERLETLVKEVVKWSVQIDRARIGLRSSALIAYLMESLLLQADYIELYEKIVKVIQLLHSIDIRPDLWQAQNIYFTIGRKMLIPMSEKASHGDEHARGWLAAFHALGHHLEVRLI